MIKQCLKCENLKYDVEFYKDTNTEDGLTRWCKQCYKEYRWSDKGKAKDEKYAQSEKGKMSGQKAKIKYRASNNGKKVERECKRKYRLTPKGKELVQEWNRSEGFKRAQEKYKQSVTRQKTKQQYEESGQGKAARKRYKKKNALKIRARAVVNNAIKKGELSKPIELECKECGRQAKEYHHDLGYEEEHWFDIIPLCIECHVSAGILEADSD